MGEKSRNNFALSGSLTQEKFDSIFVKKLFSVHGEWCPDDCSFGWTSAGVADNFNISIDELEKLAEGEIYFNDYITVMRDK